MPWEENILTRTLMIQRIGAPPNYTYRLHGYMRVTTRNGETFMEPIPGGDISLPHQGLTFGAVEFIDPPGSGQYGAGDTWMTRDSNEMSLRLTV